MWSLSPGWVLEMSHLEPPWRTRKGYNTKTILDTRFMMWRQTWKIMHDPQVTWIETYPECVTDISTELLVEKLVHAHTNLELRESFDDTQRDIHHSCITDISNWRASPVLPSFRPSCVDTSSLLLLFPSPPSSTPSLPIPMNVPPSKKNRKVARFHKGYNTYVWVPV